MSSESKVDALFTTSFSEHVYNSYVKEDNDDGFVIKIGHIGCNTCVDSMYFAEKGNMVYAIDPNGKNDRSHEYCKLIVDDVEEVLSQHKLRTLFDIIYTKDYLHSVPLINGENIITKSIQNLKPNGIMCIETLHEQTIYDSECVDNLIKSNDVDMVERATGKTHDDKLVTRLIIRRKVIPYYEDSPNFPIYKDLPKKMRKETLKSYKEMDKMNAILKKHNIQYVAVSGTILGLHRHGGIIPWDNDIDIGFIYKEWVKLLDIKDELKDAGLTYKGPTDTWKEWWRDPDEKNLTGVRHCYAGTIDCFLLKNIHEEYYKGRPVTYCYKDEYTQVCKQKFGYTYIHAPIDSTKSMTLRYGDKYYDEGDVNDNYHFKDKNIPRFKLDYRDMSFQTK